MKNLLVVFLFTLLTPNSMANFLELDGSSSHLKGPNCWNGAMYAAGVLEHRRFMHPDEWNYYLTNNCSELEEPRAGTLGRIYLNGEAEVHGFIHLDEHSIFAKHGEDQAHGYKVMSYEEMLNQYGRTRSCRTSNSTAESCYHQIKYYSCNKPQVFSGPLSIINDALEELSFSQETKLIFKDDCLSESFKAREAQLDRILAALRELSNLQGRNQDLERVLLKSYSHQIYNLQVSNRNYRCSDRKLKYAKVKAVKALLRTTFTIE